MNSSCEELPANASIILEWPDIILTAAVTYSMAHSECDLN